MTAEQKDGSTAIELVIYYNQLYYSQYKWREMIIFKTINVALKDIDHHQDQITNMSNLRERERDQYRNTNNNAVVMETYIYFFMERQREKLKTIEQEYVTYRGPLIKLCCRASFRNNVVEHYPWSLGPEIMFPIPALGSSLSQLFH